MTLHVLSAKQLAEKVIGRKELFILDVRNESDFNDWKIEGEAVEIINVPYFELLEGLEPVENKLPKDKEILVVCAKEGSSKFVAEQLDEAGYAEVAYLEGGMKTWSEYLHPVKIADLRDGELYQFVRIGKGCLSYAVISQGEAVIIDSNRTVDVYEAFLKEHHATLTNVLDTHLHADHISGGRELAKRTGASYWLPPKDATEVTFDYKPLEEGNVITVGNSTITVQPIYSPGHTIGSTSFVIDDQFLLTGDILFVESIGRPDLAGLAEDWVGDLRNTLYELYKNLPGHLSVLPAHYSRPSELNETGAVIGNLGELYEKNAGLQVHDEGVFRKMVTENLPPQPNAYQEIRQTNMGKLSPDEAEQREMEIGPNRCAVHE